jgi:hypothetical protein
MITQKAMNPVPLSLMQVMQPDHTYVTYLSLAKNLVLFGVIWRSLVLFGPKNNLFFGIEMAGYGDVPNRPLTAINAY